MNVPLHQQVVHVKLWLITILLALILLQPAHQAQLLQITCHVLKVAVKLLMMILRILHLILKVL